MESAPQASGHDDRNRLPPDEFAAPAWQAVSRGVAMFLGAFTLLNLVAEIRWSGFDAEFWWIDLRPLPPQLARGFLAWAAILLIWYAARPQIEGGLRTMVLTAVILLMSGVLWNVYLFYADLKALQVHSSFPLPLALHAAAALLVVFAGVKECPRDPQSPLRDALLATLAFTACAVGFPLAQMYCAGLSYERRKSDAVAVFANHEGGDDRLSDVNAVLHTAAELHSAGLAQTLIVVAPESMFDDSAWETVRATSAELKVPETDLVLLGVSSPQSAVSETAARCAELELERVLIVAPFQQLPRLRLLFRRQGFNAQTVPGPRGARREQLPQMLAAEVAGLWRYYVSPLAE
jgi:hypothetical protein